MTCILYSIPRVLFQKSILPSYNSLISLDLMIPTGNLGNLPLIIIPALCKEKGSPFGDPDACYTYGMAYASLSMAVSSGSSIIFPHTI